MNRHEKINAIIDAQIKIQSDIIIDDELFDNLEKKFNIFSMSRITLLMTCEDYKKILKNHNNKQAMYIKSLTEDNLINYCIHNNLKTYNNQKIIDKIKHHAQHYNSIINDMYNITYEILKPNKKILNKNLNNLFNKQVFTESCNNDLIPMLYGQLKIQYDLYIRNLYDKYNKMKDTDLDILYMNYTFMSKLKQ